MGGKKGVGTNSHQAIAQLKIQVAGRGSKGFPLPEGRDKIGTIGSGVATEEQDDQALGHGSGDG